MRRFYTAESVTEGHPDKLCDLIADSILDECLKQDPEAKVACEVLATKGYILIAGEITSRYEPYVFWTAKEVLEKTGYPSGEIKMERPGSTTRVRISQGRWNAHGKNGTDCRNRLSDQRMAQVTRES